MSTSPTTGSDDGSQAEHAFARAMELLMAGQLGGAEQALRQLLAASPQHVQGLHMLGIVLAQTGRLAEGQQLLETALGLAGRDAGIESNLGNLQRLGGDLPAAIASYRQALELDPANSGLHKNLSGALKLAGDSAAAAQAAQAGLRLSPDDFELHEALASALLDLRQFDGAIVSYGRAVMLQPLRAASHANLSWALCLAGQLEASLAAGYEALRLDGQNLFALRNTATVLQKLNRLEEASQLLDRAIALAPDDAELRLNRSFADLSLGRFDRGLTDHEARWNVAAIRRGIPACATPPAVPVEDAAGKSALLVYEQGLGDTLLFVRYARELRRHARAVHLLVQKPLLGLLAASSLADSVCSPQDPLPEHDLCTSLLSLPWWLRTTVSTIPASVPYLVAPPAGVERWRSRLGSKPGRRVGLVWAGNAMHVDDHNRSVPFAALEPLFRLPGIQWISLQRDPRPGDLEMGARYPGFVHAGGELGDFADTAGAMAHLDLVISVDSAPAHLAGGLGRPLWVMLPFSSDWRWLHARSDSPWYPTARLFRQSRPGDWRGVVEALQRALVR